MFGKTPLKAQNDYVFQTFGGPWPFWPPLATPMSPTTARGANPDREAISSGPRGHFPNYSPRAKSGARIHFVNNEKLIDKKLFELVECNISRNNHIT